MASFKISDGYKLIFLGDIVDRGNYSLEILCTLAKFITENNKANGEIDDWKLFINRGNHENISMYHRNGFSEELKKKNYLVKEIQIYIIFYHSCQ